jgi:hypothetical protein
MTTNRIGPYLDTPPKPPANALIKRFLEQELGRRLQGLGESLAAYMQREGISLPPLRVQPRCDVTVAEEKL